MLNVAQSIRLANDFTKRKEIKFYFFLIDLKERKRERGQFVVSLIQAFIG